MKRVVLILLVLSIAGMLIWYLFLKPYDYMATLEVRTFPGAINQSLKTWDMSLEDSEILDGNDLLELKQRMRFGDSVFVYQWNVRGLTDSLSEIRVTVLDENNSLMNRLTRPFTTTDFERRTKNTILDFHSKLQEHISNFRVNVTGEAEMPVTYCAYLPIEARQVDKALGMMRTYSLLSNFLAENEVKLNGQPFVQITDWNRDKDSIRYDFCFPIEPSDSLPRHQEIRYKQFEGGRALKAVYNGNYITSDRAWYALLDHADKKGIQVNAQPVEVFFNNPNMGGDALQWRAEIYMPLKEEQ